MQLRKRIANKEVHVDEHGREVIKLKGPWQVCAVQSLLDSCVICRVLGLCNRSTASQKHVPTVGVLELSRATHLV